MRSLQKIVRNGNASHVAIPRQAMFWLGWLPGEAIVLEVLEDRSVRLRRPAADEFLPKHMPILKLDNTLPVTK